MWAVYTHHIRRNYMLNALTLRYQSLRVVTISEFVGVTRHHSYNTEYIKTDTAAVCLCQLAASAYRSMNHSPSLVSQPGNLRQSPCFEGERYWIGMSLETAMILTPEFLGYFRYYLIASERRLRSFLFRILLDYHSEFF
jgi:hypothetical protein